MALIQIVPKSQCSSHYPMSIINQRTLVPANTHLTSGTGIVNAFIHVYSPRTDADDLLSTNISYHFAHFCRLFFNYLIGKFQTHFTLKKLKAPKAILGQGHPELTLEETMMYQRFQNNYMEDSGSTTIK